MSQTSTIPAPVLAEVSGGGSFFGSCQIAAGNFEAVLQSASNARINHGMAKPVNENIVQKAENPEQSSEFGLQQSEFDLKSFSEYIEKGDKNEIIASLKQILGEEAGEEAFELIENFAEKIELFEHVNSESPEYFNLIAQVFNLQKFFDKEFTEVSIEDQKILLETSIQNIKNILLGLEQTEQPEQFGKIEQIEQDEQSEQVAYPKQTEHFWQTGKTVKTEKIEQIEQDEQSEQVAYPKQTENFVQVEQVEQPEQPEKIEQPKKIEKIEQPEQSEQVAYPKRTEHIGQTKQVEQVKQTKQVEQVEQPEQIKPVAHSKQTENFVKIEQSKPIKENEEFYSASNLAAEIGIDTKDYIKFYDFINNLIELGIIAIQPSDGTIETTDDYNNFLSDSRIIEILANINPQILETPKEMKPDSLVKTLESLWETFEKLNENQKETVFSAFKQISEEYEMSKNTAQITTSTLKFENSGEENNLLKNFSGLTKKAESKGENQVQPEIRTVWENNVLKVELINPKTGEKLQSIPTTMSHSMQERIQEFEIVKQVIAQAKFITTPSGEQRITMQLNPEHLGQMDLRISLNNGEMQIHARVESIAAQSAIENHIGLLREGLEKQGINLERLEVSVEQREKQDAYSLADRQNGNEQRQGNRKRRGRGMQLAISVKNDANADTGRRLGYNTMEYLA